MVYKRSLRARRAAFVIPIVLLLVTFLVNLSGDLSPVVAGEAPDIDEFVAAFNMQPGFFNTYTTAEGQIYMEVTEDHFDKDLLLVVQMGQGNGESFLLAGFPLTTEMLTFRMRGQHIDLIHRNTNFRADPGTAAARMVELGFRESVKQAFQPVAANKDQGRYLLDVTGFFLDDYVDLASIGPGMYGTGLFFDRSRSDLSSVKAFPQNLNVKVNLTFGASGFINSPTVPDPKTLALNVSYSLLALPEDPMQARLSDDRVGYFTTTYRDFSRQGQLSDAIRLTNRWRLEKRDPYAPLSEPVKPIVYYLENTIPDKYKEYVREGVEAWNKAFEAAGFKNAVLALDQPNDPNWDAGDARYSTIRWVPAIDSVFAIGPSDVDPRTGEILNADILVVSDWVSSFSNESNWLELDPFSELTMENENIQWLNTINPEAAERLCALGATMSGQIEILKHTLIADGIMATHNPVPTEYIGDALREIVMHEVGHTLGLRHNFKGSTITPHDRIHNPAYTQEHGVSGSVMDYNPPNIAMDRSQQGEYYNSVVGPYDIWAIEWGYKPVGNETLSEPHLDLSALAAENWKREYRYATDEDTGLGSFAMDPYVNQYDMGEDPITFYSDLNTMIDGMWNGLEDRIIPDDGEYWPLRNTAHYLLFQKWRGYAWMSKGVGGIEVFRPHKGSPGELTPFMPLSGDDQRRALEFILTGFQPDVLGTFPLEMVNKMTNERRGDWASNWGFGQRLTYPIHDFVTWNRALVLNVVFNPERLMRIRDNAFISDESNPFTLDELFEGFSDEIWADVLTGQAPADSLQREAQSIYLDLLISLGSNDPELAAHLNHEHEVARGEVPGSHLPPSVNVLQPWLNDVHALAFAQLVEIHEGIENAIASGRGDAMNRAHWMETANRIEQSLVSSH